MELVQSASEEAPAISATPKKKIDINDDDSPVVKQYKRMVQARELARGKYYEQSEAGSCFHSSAPMPWYTKYRPSSRPCHTLLHPLHPLWVFLFLALVPPAMVGLIFGGIPVFNPRTLQVVEKLPYLLVFVPVTFTSYVMLINVFWLGILEIRTQGVETLRYYIVPLICGLVLPTVTMLLILPWTIPFPAIGMIPYGVAVSTFLATLFLFRQSYSACKCEFFPTKRWTMIKVMISAELTFCLFVAYTLVFRQIPGSYQKLMTAVWVFVLYLIKKVGLTVTEEAPYELSFLFAGFALQNLADIFFTFVYPTVQDPQSTFTAIFFITSGTDYLYLCLLTSKWMRFRVCIKSRLKTAFCCLTFDPELSVPILEDLYDDDRGQTNLSAGYARRQIQFFYYRISSGIFAQIFFLIATPIFRNWTNRDYYPFSLNSPLR